MTLERIVIQGGSRLSGQLVISGAKNAALPLLCVSLLTDQPVTLTNLPRLADIKTMTELLDQHGVQINWEKKNTPSGHDDFITMHTPSIKSTTAPYDIVRKMRASILVLGPLLTRWGEASVSLPGGCAIGTRPVDVHIKGLQAMGAEIELVDGYIHAKAPIGGLVGATYTFPVVSVTGTENLLMAACLARGTTILKNAAREPEIADLAHCLNAMGANITGMNTDKLIIEGVDHLHGATHRILSDRIETGTYAMAAALTGGDLELIYGDLDHIPTVTAILEQSGVVFTPTAQGFRVTTSRERLVGVDVMTEPFPGFATDLQAQMMALMTVSEGASMLTETIFENRFMHVPELCRMGANITVHGASALVRGVSKLKGAPVMATDLRASVSLVMAGLVAEGETILNRIYHLDRGYESVELKLSQCGAKIYREAA